MSPADPASGPPVEDLPTREGYDRWAAIYDSEENPLVLLEEPHVIRLLGDVRDRAIADIGCGTGRHALRLAAAGARVTAVDFSGEMLSRARAKPGASAVRFVEHDLARALPLESAAFDRVVCGLVLDHIEDLVGLFREMRRICKPGCFVVVSNMHPALLLRGVQARFTDPQTGRQTRPQSRPHQLSDYVLAAIRAGLWIDDLGEHVMDAGTAARSERAARYVGWPMLFMMKLLPHPPGRRADPP